MKKNDLKILKFPNSIANLERQVEAILFAAEEPLDEEIIKEKLNTRTNISKILESLEKQYKNRGINLICISKKWSFRTASNLSKFMNIQIHTKKKLSKAAIETLDSIVSISRGSAAAKTIASTSLSPELSFSGKFTTLFFFVLLIFLFNKYIRK